MLLPDTKQTISSNMKKQQAHISIDVEGKYKDPAETEPDS